MAPPSGPPLYMYTDISQLLGDFLTGEYFIHTQDVSSPPLILKVDGKDDVYEKYDWSGSSEDAGLTTPKSQKYYDPHTETESFLKPATGKEMHVAMSITRVGGGQFSSANVTVWAGTTQDSTTGARDVFGGTIGTGSSGRACPPFILKAGEYLTLQSNSDTVKARITNLVAVERDAT